MVGMFFCSDKEELLPEEQSSVESLSTPDSPTKADKAWGFCNPSVSMEIFARNVLKCSQNWENVVLLMFIGALLERSI